MRKKGLVEKIVMGEPANVDFSQKQFPENRAKLFSYMLKNKFSKIYKNHLLTAVFFVPLIVWSILTLGYSNWVFGLEPNEGITHFFEHWLTVYVTAIPMWALGFVGLSGGLNVIRKLAWSDPVMLKRDFLQGIKVSGKQMAIVGLVWGIAYALFRYSFDWLGFYYRVFDESSSIVFGMILCLMLLIVFVGFTVYMACMSSMYSVSLGQLLVGAFKLYFADFFLASGVILASLLPIFLPMLTGLTIVVLIVYLLILGLLLGIIIIPMFLVCQHSFDRIINKKDYPEYYGKGLSYGKYSDTNALEEADSLKEETNCDRALGDVEQDFERVSDVEN